MTASAGPRDWDATTTPDGVPRVLIVDDHPPNLLALEGILDPLGLDVVSATSGEGALMEVLKADFAVILMDVQMPGLDGFATTTLIKNRERSRHIPVIFLTAISRDAEHIFQGYAHGAVDYLLKPFDPAILRSKVRVFVDLWRQRQVIQRQERELRRREREALELREEARFRELTDSLPSIVWATDASGWVYYANEAWRLHVGDAATALDIRELPGVHPDDAEGVRAQWHRSIELGEPFEWQFRLLWSTGERPAEYRWHLGRAVPRRQDGEVVGWLATGTDIDDRKRAEMVLSYAARASARLAESLSLRAAAEAVADLLVPELATLASVQLLTGDRVDLEVVRHAAGDDVAEQIHEITSRPADGGRESTIEAVGRLEHLDEAVIDGLPCGPDQKATLRALDVTSCVAVPLSVQQRVLGVLWAARTNGQPKFDAEEIRAIEDLARRASMTVENASLLDLAQREQARAEDANRVKDHFLATVSHELRTPLTAMLGWTTMLIEGKVAPERQPKALETILRSVRTQTQLIDDLLDVSRITSGKLRLAMTTVAPHEVVEAAMDVVRPSASAKQIDLQIAVDRDAGLVLADPDRLQQVVWNLLANAIKFSPKGSRISVGLDRCGDHLEISVADEGLGISPAFLPHVFEPFRQAEGGSGSHGGLGLGLAISKNLVELHGGTISVSSEGEGRGARFVVCIPTRAVAWAGEAVAEPH